MKKWEQTGKRGEESSLRVCCVSQHIAAHTVCEKASREIKKKKAARHCSASQRGDDEDNGIRESSLFLFLQSHRDQQNVY